MMFQGIKSQTTSTSGAQRLLIRLLLIVTVLIHGAIALADTLPTVVGRVTLGSLAQTSTSGWEDAITTPTLSLASGDKVLALAAVSMESTNQGNAFTSSFRFGICDPADTLGNCDAYSSDTTPSSGTFVQRYLAGQGTNDRGMASLVHVFSAGGDGKEIRLQHKDGVANNLKTHGNVVAIRLKSTDSTSLDYDYKAYNTFTSHTTDDTWQTVKLGASDEYLTVTIPANAPTSSSIFIHASLNAITVDQDTETCNTSTAAQYRMQFATDPLGTWETLGPTVTRGVSKSAIGAIAKSGMLEDQAVDTYYIRLQQYENSGTCQLRTSNVSMVGLALGLSTGLKFDSFSRIGSNTTTVTSFDGSATTLATSATIEVTTETPVFMHSTINVSDADETSTAAINFARFREQVSGSSGDCGTGTGTECMTGNELLRYVSDGGSGSGSIFNRTDSTTESETDGTADSASTPLEVGATYTVSLQHHTDSNSTQMTTSGQIYGFALTTGSVVNVTRASVTGFSASASPDRGSDIRWQTASEVGTAGFHLERWDKVTKAYVRVSDELVKAPLMAPLGSNYHVKDLGAFQGETHRYRLIESELGGGERTYGPYIVRIPNKISANAQRGQKGNPQAKLPAEPRSPSVASFERRSAAQDARSLKSGKPGISQGSRIRINIPESGLYQLTSAEIANLLGVSEKSARAQLARRGFELSHMGQPLSYLLGQANDSLLFYAEGINSIHTAENVYWLDWGKGEMMRQQNVSPGKLDIDPEVAAAASFLHVQDYEEETIYQPFLFRDTEADLWIWDAVVANESKSYTLDSPGAAATGRAKIRARLSGGSDVSAGLDHHVYVSVNGVEVGEAVWDGFTERIIEAEFDGEILTSEQTIVTLRGVRDSGVELSWVLVDGFELEYQRHYQAIGDRLLLTGNQNAVVQATGFSSDQVLLLDVTDVSRPVWHKNPLIEMEADGKFSVTFTTQDGRRYLLSSGAGAQARLEAAERSDLKNRPRNADYLVISPDELLDVAEELAAYRSDRFDTSVIRLSDIYDEYNHGVVSPHAIKAFLKEAYANWSVKPAYVVLAGKGTYDPKDHWGLGTNLLPILTTLTSDGVFPSDVLFADVVGDDRIPEFAIGRLPVLSAKELTAYIDKLKAYEAPGNVGDWRSRALLVADDAEATARFDNESDRVALALPADFEQQKVYYEEGSGSSAPYTESIIDQLNQGALVFNYVGHGSFQVLADEELLTLSHAQNDLLPSEGRYPAFFAFTCLVGNSSWLYVDSLAEELVLKPDAGAIIAVSPTGSSVSSDAHTINAAVMDVLFEDPDITVGQALNLGISALSLSEHQDYMLSLFGLMGDPAVRLKWTEE